MSKSYPETENLEILLYMKQTRNVLLLDKCHKYQFVQLYLFDLIPPVLAKLKNQ